MSLVEQETEGLRPRFAPATIPDGAPSKIDPPDAEDLVTVNFGPNHPSTHGVLHLIVDLNGEPVEGVDDLQRLMAGELIGERVVLTTLREGRVSQVELVPVELEV